MKTFFVATLLLLAQIAAFAQDTSLPPEKISLWSNHAPVGGGEFQEADATITVHRAAKPNGAAFVICPGGGYGRLMTAPEGHGIARWLNEHGVTGIVLEYRLPQGKAFVPLLDAQRAIRVVRSRAAEWSIDPKRIGIMGFSAGGHLASTAGTHFDAGDAKATDAIERVSCRPDFMILVYPVITMGEKGHRGSRTNLLGADAKPELVELFSNQKQITAQTPPTFLAHAADDKGVPPINSKMFYDALKANGVEAKYLELPSGGHGLNGYKGPMWDAWQAQSLEWLAAQKFIPAADAAPMKGEASTRKPDIVFLLADDLGNADVGWHGSDIKTPNLDKLAASGAKLEDFYVLPVCTPTRCAFLTGRYPMRFGMQMNVLRPQSKYGMPLEERTVGQAMRDAGYTTAIIGKWHVGEFDKAYWPNARGFDHWYGLLQDVDYFTHIGHGTRELDWHRDGKLCHDEGYTTHLLAKDAVAVIKRQPKDKPLFLYVPFNAVHGPLQAPDEYIEPYKATMNAERAVLAGTATAMDEACGQILAALDETGRRDNTLIVFASDNGGIPPGKNLPYRGFKSSMYEGGIRSPACVAWAGRIQPGTVVKEPMHIVDLFPTFVKLAGGNLEQKLPLDGRDILPVLTEGKPSPHEDILLNTTPRDGALRMGDWKLVVNGLDAVSDARDTETGARKKVDRAEVRQSREKKFELFNLRDDPSEQHDLAAQQPKKLKELQRRYDAYAKAAVKPLQLQLQKKEGK